ncbi:tyrosine-type recombinase/integrase [Nonomuraea ceibae]|uniref:tyrosine-type recombinase/integrase n=1 Tax=Nonomuraea ceibae TaxID=1935170 RepID=UPI001C5D2B02|nr:site-specific integrase [Nonomuraea ceibae]
MATFVLPELGRLQKAGDQWAPYQIVDQGGIVVGPVRAFFAELQAEGKSASTVRSYGMDLLRWWRFLWALDIEWNRATRADARDCERLPALSTVVRAARANWTEAQEGMDALRVAPLGGQFMFRGRTYTRQKKDSSTPFRAYDESGRRIHLGLLEERAFWAWATIEFLQHAGVRIEEMLEASHHALIQYKLPTSGDIVPLLQVAPSKTDEERLLLVSPELADVLSTVIARGRDPRTGAIPMLPIYDVAEKIWNPPMPLLFQWTYGGQRTPVSRQMIRDGLNEVLKRTGLTDSAGKPLDFAPHDFRRIFITDAIRSGLPPHIAQVLAGHSDINTTMGYNAIYPADAIEAHRAFIARQRSLRPSEEYRTPTNEEWDAFLAHFEKRKLSGNLRSGLRNVVHPRARLRPMFAPPA